MKVLNYFFEKINSSKYHSYYYMTPTLYTVGNCALDIYHGVFAARSRNKKLFLLYPYDIPFIFRWKLTNKELFKLESDHIVKQNLIVLLLSRSIVTLIFIPLRLYALILRDIFNKEVGESIILPRIGEKEIYTPPNSNKGFDYENIKKYALDWYQGQTVEFGISGEYSLKLKDNLTKKLGIGKDNWYVCLHVREAGFRGDEGRREYRNSDIYTYIEAIKEITSRGGFVVRMGDCSMKKMPSMEGVIDYPFTEYKSDINDLILIKHCHFYIGTHSGILDVANLFSKKILITNMVDWGPSGLYGENTRGILKHCYSIDEKKYLSIEHIFKNGIGFIPGEHAIWKKNTDEYKWESAYNMKAPMKGYKLIDNDEKEIKNAVVEFINFVNSGSNNSSYFQTLAKKYRTLYANKLLYGAGIYMFGSRRRRMIENCYFSLRCELSTGYISECFLKENWHYNSRNK